MGTICSNKQNEQNFSKGEKFTLLHEKQSYKKFKAFNWCQKCIIKIEVMKKTHHIRNRPNDSQIQCNSSIIDESCKNVRKIKATIDEEGVNIINQGIFEDKLSSALIQQANKGVSWIIVEQPQCDNRVNIKQIFTIVIKGILDAQAIQKKKNNNQQQQLQNANNNNNENHNQNSKEIPKNKMETNKRIMVIVCWPRLPKQCVEESLAKAQQF